MSGDRFPPVVRITGELAIHERIVPLAGYDGHDSVRIGNQAYRHTQNDVYGQVIFALLQLYIDERFPQVLKYSSKQLIVTILERIGATRWPRRCRAT